LAGHMACIWEKRNAYRVLMGKPEGKSPLGRVGIDWMIILKWISKKKNWTAWIGLLWLKIDTEIRV